MQKILIASTNEGKVREIKEHLKDLPFEILSLADVKNQIQDFEPEETGTTFEENALIKAIAYAKRTNLPTLADDSGLCVEALDDRPGIYTGRYADHDQIKGNEKLLGELKDVPMEKRDAYYQAVIVYFDPKTNEKFVAEGRLNGKIALEPKGTQGFAFDPIFYYPPFDKNIGEISVEEKNKISHRGQALKKIEEFLKKSLI